MRASYQYFWRDCNLVFSAVQMAALAAKNLEACPGSNNFHKTE